LRGDRQFEAGKTSSDVIFAANLVIEEIVTNTIKYAYRDSLRIISASTSRRKTLSRSN
jgi:anti-sigma regulatory factor (Ser/Thr protein kinase)